MAAWDVGTLWLACAVPLPMSLAAFVVVRRQASRVFEAGPPTGYSYWWGFVGGIRRRSDIERHVGVARRWGWLAPAVIGGSIAGWFLFPIIAWPLASAFALMVLGPSIGVSLAVSMTSSLRSL